MTRPVLTQVRGRAGIITLNRPQAMNALNHEMVTLIAQALQQWRNDDAVALVILRGAGERGLCAGGDVVSLYHDALAGGTEGAEFWADEYRLNLTISQYPKPYVALMTGIVLGGGIGVSAHGSHRVVTDDTRVGMPETGIGFVPDVGGSWLLAHAPGGLGVHLGLTGQHVGARFAIAAGVADSYVPTASLEALVEKLCETGDPACLMEFTAPAPGDEAPVGLEQAYAPDTVEEILADLEARAQTQDWAADAAKRIRRNSPLALKVTLEALRRACGQSLAQVLGTEFRVSVNMQRGHDFAEGIRAQLVDKDRSPKWEPATLDEVTDRDVAAVLGPIRDPRVSEIDLTEGGADD